MALGKTMHLRHCSWLLAGLLAPGLVPTAPALAQLIPDTTLGNEATLVMPGVLVQGNLADQIGGGAIRGRNLFHSFLEFNINAGQRVYFANPAGIEAILTRVTGGHPSNILGTLGVDGAADLFFINPNGLVFGENATLDIPGSFYASTAEVIPLGNGFYSATAPAQSTLLTVNPSALFSTHLSPASGDIQSRGQLVAQENLTLAAHTLDLQGQVAAGGDLTLLGNTVRIRDGVDAPFVGFAGGDLLVEGHDQVDIVALSHADSGLYSYGDMVLRSANPVGGDAHYWSGGSFRVETLDGEVGRLFSPIDPIIRTFNDVVIDEYEGSSLHILAGGSVTIGTAIITAADPGERGIDFLRETITLSDGTVVAIDGGAQPTLDIRAGVAPQALGEPPLDLLTGFNNNTLDTFRGDAFVTGNPSNADITVGDVYMNAPNGLVLLTNQYQSNPTLAGGDIAVTGEGRYGDGIDARGFGGQGGTVYLDARNDVLITNSSIETAGAGVVGDVVINADNTVRIEQQDRRTVVNSSIATGATGTGGDVRIRATTVEVLGGAQLSASVFGSGNAGNVEITADESVTFEGRTADGEFSSAAFSSVESGAVGNGGNVVIHTGSLYVRNGALLSASTLGTGDAGNVDIEARDTVIFDGGDSYSRVGNEGVGTGGNVVIRASSLEVLNGAQVDASTDGNGNAGNVEITAAETVVFDNGDVFTSVGSGAGGNGGNVVIHAGSLEVLNGAQLQSSTRGRGNAGSVEITARDGVTFDGRGPSGQFPSAAFSSVASGAVGNGGNVVIHTGSLRVRNGAQLQSSARGRGHAGNVEITADESVVFDNGDVLSSVGSGAVGNGGNVVIHTGSLEVLNGAQLSASTFGNGNAGNVEITARNGVTFEGRTADGEFSSAAFSSVESGAVGNGGNVVIHTGSLEVRNGAVLSASTFGAGDAGNVDLEARDAVIFDGGDAYSRVRNEGVGTGGNVVIRAGSLEVLNGAQLSASTFGNGHAGNVDITARDGVTFDGSSADGQFPSAAFSSVESGAVGDGGDVVIHTGSLEVLNGARLSASTFGNGHAGNVDMTADESMVFDNGDVFTSVESRAVGNGGDVVIHTGSLEVLNGAQLQSLTRGRGNAGSVEITARNGVTFEGRTADGRFPSAAFSSVASGAVGNGGDVVIHTGSLEILNGAQLSASTFGNGNAGNVDITASRLELNEGGRIVAESASVDGGNIDITLDDLLLMRNGSLISATAGTDQAGGNGGNITIAVPFIIAVREENSDIAADAFEGDGGTVNITASGIFGIEPRDQRTRFSDITASSERGAVSGVVTLNTLDTSAITNSLASPSDVVIDTNVLTAGSCIGRTGPNQGSFVVTGSGGLPLRPGDSAMSSYPTGTVRPLSAPAAPLQEPDGVYQLPDGRLVLSRACGSAVP